MKCSFFIVLAFVSLVLAGCGPKINIYLDDPEYDKVALGDSAERVMELLGEPDKKTDFDTKPELWSFESELAKEILLAPMEEIEDNATDQLYVIFRIDNRVLSNELAMEPNREVWSENLWPMSRIVGLYGDSISKRSYLDTKEWYYFDSIPGEDGYVRWLTIDTGKDMVIYMDRLFGGGKDGEFFREFIESK